MDEVSRTEYGITAFSILLFTETGQSSGFFLKKKATLYAAAMAIYESEMP
jgi:hypothetical protein